MTRENQKRMVGRALMCRGGWILLALGMALLAGCAPGGTGVPAPPAVAPQESQGPQGPVVQRLQDGRRGFSISETSPKRAQVLAEFNQALELLQQQDYYGAIELLQRVIAQAPEVSPPYIDIAVAYRKVEMPEEAEAALKKALELVPGHPLASNEYGLLLRAAGRFDEARKVYEEGLQHFPEYLPLHRNLGILCDIYLGDRVCALEHYRIYAQAKPDDEQVKTWIADLRLRSGQK